MISYEQERFQDIGPSRVYEFGCSMYNIEDPRRMNFWREKQASVLLEIEMIVVVQICAVVEY